MCLSLFSEISKGDTYNLCGKMSGVVSREGKKRQMSERTFQEREHGAGHGGWAKD